MLEYVLGQLAVLGGVILTAYGLVVMFFGYRLYRLWATLLGIAVGAALAVWLSYRFLPDIPLLHYFVGLAGALVGGLTYFYVSVFFLGASFGVIIMLLLHLAWLVFQDVREYDPITAAIKQAAVFYAVTAVVSGCLALVFRRPLLILFTALGGAAMALDGAALAMMSRRDRIIDLTAGLVAFVILSVVAVIVQWKTSDVPLDVFAAMTEKEDGKKKRSKKKSKADAEEE